MSTQQLARKRALQAAAVVGAIAVAALGGAQVASAAVPPASAVTTASVNDLKRTADSKQQAYLAANKAYAAAVSAGKPVADQIKLSAAVQTAAYEYARASLAVAKAEHPELKAQIEKSEALLAKAESAIKALASATPETYPAKLKAVTDLLTQLPTVTGVSGATQVEGTRTGTSGSASTGGTKVTSTTRVEGANPATGKGGPQVVGVERKDDAKTRAEAAKAADPKDSVLAVTGSDAVTVAGVGAAVLAAGAGVVLVTRRRRRATTFTA